MEKIKVLQIVPNFQVGGAEKVVLDYLLNQHRALLEIRAVSLYGYQETIYTKAAQASGADVVYLNKRPGLDVSVLPRLRRVIADYKPDVVHTHLYTLKYALLASLFLGVSKRFHTVHSRPDKDGTLFDKIVNSFAFKYLGFVPITLHGSLQALTNEYYKIDSAVILENGVDIDRYTGITECAEDIRREFGIPCDAFVVGHVGSFNKVKNHEFMLKVFSHITQVRRSSYLVFVGGGPRRSEIEAMTIEMGINDKVKFLGLRSDIPRILRALDVFIFPSLYEGFPISLIEAQVSGVRAVVSESVPSDAIISTNVTRLSLSQNIMDWVDVILKRENGEVVKDLAKYSIETIVKKLEKIYRGLDHERDDK